MRKRLAYMREKMVDDEFRYRLQFLLASIILGAVSFGMTVVNAITQQFPVFWGTLAFFVFCALFAALLRFGKPPLALCNLLFIVSTGALFTFFIISGSPEGFSILWIGLLPTCGMLLLGRRYGTMACVGMLLVVLFFFDTPLGLSLLQYPYNDTFKMRFPMLLIGFYFVSLFFESVRVWTQDAMQSSRQKYEYLYQHDALTGVYNRYGFNRRLTELSGASATAVFMILDIDHFKQVNDEFGHLNGDVALTETARRIAACFADDGAVCRWGGEEFAVLILKDWTEEHARQKAEAVRMMVQNEPIDVDGKQLRLTVSIGVVVANETCQIDINRLIKQTDDRLYEAKNTGRNRTVISRFE